MEHPGSFAPWWWEHMTEDSCPPQTRLGSSEAEAWAGTPPEILLLFNHSLLSNVSRTSQNSNLNERTGIQKLEPVKDIQIQIETGMLKKMSWLTKLKSKTGICVSSSKW